MSEPIDVIEGRARWCVVEGDALAMLAGMPDGSVDAIVTDPPAGISFMGCAWDHHRGGRAEWVAWLASIFREALRVAKPGAHALVWALPRTSHWTATAVEGAGWEIRDCLTHLFATGFPKSLDVFKAIGEEWSGWGTALKPAAEFWYLARKPLIGTVAANVLAHGTGALNIDGCRVSTGRSPSIDRRATARATGNAPVGGTTIGGWRHGIDPGRYSAHRESEELGRFPPNLLLSHAEECGSECVEGCPVAELDEQSGRRDGCPVMVLNRGATTGRGMGCASSSSSSSSSSSLVGYGDTGGASRFFPTFRYEPKPSRGEREAGLREAAVGSLTGGGPAARDPVSQRFTKIARNSHPTSKAPELMRWLCRLVTPPGGLVVDPFTGSGSTGVAAMVEGFRFVGSEREAEYVEIARGRITHAARQEHLTAAPKAPRLAAPKADQLALLPTATESSDVP